MTTTNPSPIISLLDQLCLLHADPALIEAEIQAVCEALGEDWERVKRQIHEGTPPWWLCGRANQMLPPIGAWDTIYIRGARMSGKTRTGAEALAELIKVYPCRDWGVIAPTYGDARDTCMEGPSGLIKALQQHGIAEKDDFNRGNGEMRLRCKDPEHDHKVFCDGADDGALRIQGKNLAGVWCVAEGEPVLTRRGWVPVESVHDRDEVWTRQGWRAVTAHALMRADAPVLRIETDSGDALRCTEDHPVWVRGRGWVLARDVTVGDTLELWKHHEHPRAPRTSSGMAPAGTARHQATISPARECSCIAASMSERTGRSLTGSSSTTSTTTQPTTTCRTCRPYRKPITCGSTDFWESLTRPLSAGKSPRPSARLGRSASLGRALAKHAAGISPRRGSARSSAPAGAGTKATVTAVEPDGASDVYDLTVAGAHEFYASGVLVKNCDEVGLWRIVANKPRSHRQQPWNVAWSESIDFAVRIEPAITIATGTPKSGHPLVRMLLKDDEVLKRHLKLEDNESNVSGKKVRKLRRRYEGTRLWRQEGGGEYIEEVEGALWSDTLIESQRITVDKVPWNDLIQIGVTLDPAVTTNDDSDETGSITVATDSAGNAYVLRDLSGKHEPEVYMDRAIREYNMRDASWIIAEVNNGGDLIEKLLRTRPGGGEVGYVVRVVVGLRYSGGRDGHGLR